MMRGVGFSRVVEAILVVVLTTSIFVSAATNVAANDIASGTIIDHDITEDTIWTPEGSPYVIIGHIKVLKNVTLTVLPGVDVIFSRDSAIEVEGKLIVNGSKGETVYMHGEGDDIEAKIVIVLNSTVTIKNVTTEIINFTYFVPDPRLVLQNFSYGPKDPEFPINETAWIKMENISGVLFKYYATSDYPFGLPGVNQQLKISELFFEKMMFGMLLKEGHIPQWTFGWSDVIIENIHVGNVSFLSGLSVQSNVTLRNIMAMEGICFRGLRFRNSTSVITLHSNLTLDGIATKKVHFMSYTDVYYFSEVTFRNVTLLNLTILGYDGASCITNISFVDCTIENICILAPDKSPAIGAAFSGKNLTFVRCRVGKLYIWAQNASAITRGAVTTIRITFNVGNESVNITNITPVITVYYPARIIIEDSSIDNITITTSDWDMPVIDGSPYDPEISGGGGIILENGTVIRIPGYGDGGCYMVIRSSAIKDGIYISGAKFREWDTRAFELIVESSYIGGHLKPKVTNFTARNSFLNDVNVFVEEYLDEIQYANFTIEGCLINNLTVDYVYLLHKNPIIRNSIIENLTIHGYRAINSTIYPAPTNVTFIIENVTAKNVEISFKSSGSYFIYPDNTFAKIINSTIDTLVIGVGRPYKIFLINTNISKAFSYYWYANLYSINSSVRIHAVIVIEMENSTTKVMYVYYWCELYGINAPTWCLPMPYNEFVSMCRVPDALSSQSHRSEYTKIPL